MRRLLLDLGNTRLKWALRDGDDWRASGAVAWNENVADALAEAWSSLPQPAAAFGASVVDAPREARVAASVAAAFGREPRWLRTPAEACGVRNAYAEPQKLGVDRFLAMVAARTDGLAPCALAADGRHLGGLIAPGPRLMQQSLLGATAQVRPAQAGTVVEAADNTADAVASGCWLAAAALIERFAARMAPALGGAPALRLGGGDAEALLPLLAAPAQLAHDSVLHGLAVWAAAQ
jgi:type III pantothenate kinase